MRLWHYHNCQTTAVSRFLRSKEAPSDGPHATQSRSEFGRRHPCGAGWGAPKGSSGSLCLMPYR